MRRHTLVVRTTKATAADGLELFLELLLDIIKLLIPGEIKRLETRMLFLKRIILDHLVKCLYRSSCV